MNEHDKIYREYISQYKTNKILSETQLKQLIQETTKNAKRAYSKLKPPITIPLPTYTSGWIRETLSRELNKALLQQTEKTTKKNSSRHLLIADIIKYFKILPGEIITNPTKEQNPLQGTNKERIQKWKKLNLPIKQIERQFKKIVISRTKIAKELGHTNSIGLFLKKNKVPQIKYQKFNKQLNNVITYCNQRLPDNTNLPQWFYSQYHIPCFICRIKKFPTKTLKETFDFIAKHHPCINKYKTKIKVNTTTKELSKITYIKETDTFNISINSNSNQRHQIISLIHELSHTISLLINFKNSIDWKKLGVYQEEENAKIIELQILTQLSPKLKQAYFCQILLNLHRILFQISLYQNPNQDLSKLNAQTFNYCFKKAKQKSNPLYILDENHIFQPFRTLPHAIASVNILSKYL